MPRCLTMDERAAERTTRGHGYGDSKRSPGADADKPPGSSAAFLGRARQEDSTKTSTLQQRASMHATIRRCESIDQSGTNKLVKQCEERLVPALRELPGFNGYSLIDSGDGVVTLDRPLRHRGAGRRVDSRRRRAGCASTSSRPRSRPRRRSPAAPSPSTRHASSSRPNSLELVSATVKARHARASPGRWNRGPKCRAS